MEKLPVFVEINVSDTRVADTNNGIKHSISCSVRNALKSAVYCTCLTRDQDIRMRW